MSLATVHDRTASPADALCVGVLANCAPEGIIACENVAYCKEHA